jgi:pyruvate dehydrogenase E2 component (dihydrolipoamide acetyltransferase)
MTFSVTMPALGESVSEGTVTRWLKAEGDHVNVDEPLLEVSTDKVDTEIPSPVSGTLQKIVVQVDQTVPVGAELAIIADGVSEPKNSAPVAEVPAQPATPVAVVETPAPVAAAPVTLLQHLQHLLLQHQQVRELSSQCQLLAKVFQREQLHVG